jgi:hypothetical protein
MRVAGRTLGSVLLGGVAILGSVLVLRQGLLPLIDTVFQLGPEWLSAFRRAGILLAAVGAYWAYVHWHEKREATELRLQPVHLMLGGAGGAALVALPIGVLFALGAYEQVLFRGASRALLGVAAIIGIAAVLEELVYRCLLFRLLERAWGTGVALAAQAVVFALLHLENVEEGGTGDVVAMLVSVTLLACSGPGCSSWRATCGWWPPITRHGTSPSCSAACRFPGSRTGARWRRSKAAMPGLTG